MCLVSAKIGYELKVASSILIDGNFFLDVPWLLTNIFGIWKERKDSDFMVNDILLKDMIISRYYVGPSSERIPNLCRRISKRRSWKLQNCFVVRPNSAIYELNEFSWCKNLHFKIFLDQFQFRWSKRALFIIPPCKMKLVFS